MISLQDIKDLDDDLRHLRSDIKKEVKDKINKTNLRSRAEGLSSVWFQNVSVILNNSKIFEEPILTKYKELFTKLLKLSGPGNLKTSYIETLNQILLKFKDELILPLSINPDTNNVKRFQGFFDDVAALPENDYINESLSCAELSFTRAATVLGWSATVYRFHSVIEQIGFNIFNDTSVRLSALDQGRFKRYSKKFSITSRNELNEVFDTDVLWILEGMGLIDLNEHARLRGCFDLRCQAAHPCNATITDHNLLSFYSDIKEIVFKNQKFSIT
jgi:hypothetical protein